MHGPINVRFLKKIREINGVFGWLVYWKVKNGNVVLTAVHVRASINISHKQPTSAVLFELCSVHAVCHKFDTVRSISTFKHVGRIIIYV